MNTLEIGKNYMFAMTTNEEQLKTCTFIYNGDNSWTLTTPKGTMTKVSEEQTKNVLKYFQK